MTLAAVNTVYVVMFLQSLVPIFISLPPASHFKFPSCISQEECPTLLVASLRYQHSQNRISQDINKALYLRLRWSRGSVLPLSTQVHRFNPGQSRQDFLGQKNPQHAFLQTGSKAVGPMSQICGK